MRASVVSLSRKLLSAFFAVTLALGLIPITAFAEPLSGPSADEPIEANASDPIEDADQNADGASSAEGADVEGVAGLSGGIINQEMALESVVAQAESTKSFFLAQTLETTKSVPVVSAKLPLDVSGPSSGSPAESLDPSMGDTSSSLGDSTEGSDDGQVAEEGKDLDEPDLGSGGVAAESTVVGSFTFDGLTYAVEPGGESVAVVAADYSKLPSEQVSESILAIPSVICADGADAHSVTRIADGAFSGLTKEVAGAFAIEDGSESSEELEGIDGEEGFAGIVAIGIPASVSSIEDGAFAGSDALQQLVVSDDDPTYSSYDGCLYDSELTSLLLIRT